MALPLAAREASVRWSHQLEAWVIPEIVLAAAPESPWGFPPSLFVRSADRALADPDFTPSRQRATEMIPPGGSVLDVGAGGGAASPSTSPAGPWPQLRGPSGNSRGLRLLRCRANVAFVRPSRARAASLHARAAHGLVELLAPGPRCVQDRVTNRRGPSPFARGPALR